MNETMADIMEKGDELERIRRELARAREDGDM